MGHTVKGSRSYDSSRRRAQAERNRLAVLAGAERRFLSAGYAATTVGEIAEDARVSVETIYKVFGGKPGLIRAIYERGLAGRGQVAAFQRSDEMRWEESDPWSLMHKWGALTAEVASTLTPILLLIRSAAASDPTIAALLAETNEQHLERMRHNARFLAERDFLRSDITFDEAVDVMWACSSPELYDLLVLQRGWTGEQFARFVANTMVAALLPYEK